MNNIYKFKATNKMNSGLSFDFTGTELEFAIHFSKPDQFTEIDYPAAIISYYESEIVRLKSNTGSRELDDELISEYKSGIQCLKLFIKAWGVDAVALMDDYEMGKLKANSIHQISRDYTIEKVED
jgi:hypothetical protein